jgi:hypothetical protein
MAASFNRLATTFRTRVVYASSLPGVRLDCVLSTGLTNSGGVPTNNAAALNAVLATATAANPVELVIDGGCAIGAPLVIPSTGQVMIRGIGWGSGLYVLSGSNANAIQNVPHTDIAVYNVWQPTAAQPITGSNVTIRDLRVCGNRGTFPTGNASNVSTNRDGTVTNTAALASAPDVRGPYTASAYWLSGIMLAGLDNVLIDHVWVYDAPSYHINLYACTKVRIVDCRVEAAVANEGNQDGIHVNGGCWDVKISRCWIQSGDDAIAFNLDEGEGPYSGDPLAGVDLSVDDCTLHNCITVGRVFGSGAITRRVSFTNIHGYVQWYGLLIGNTVAGTNQDNNHSILLDGWNVQVTGSVNGGALVWVVSNVGMIDISRLKVIEPTQGNPVILVGTGSSGPVVSSMRLAGLEIHRNASGSNSGPVLSMVGGTIQNLALAGVAVTDNGSFPGLAHLMTVASPGAISRLWVGDLDPNHITALIDNPGQLTAKLGPGLVASGF